MFLGFFFLKLLKSETLLVLFAEAKLVILSARLSKRAVYLSVILFQCNSLLLRHELSLLLLLMNLIPLPLHKFSNFLLISLITSSKY